MDMDVTPEVPNVNTMFAEATILWRRKQLLPAKELCMKALEIEEDNVNCLMRLASIHHTLGDILQAETVYRNALSLDKNHVASLTNIAALLIEKEQYQDAEEHCRRAIQVSPTHVTSLAMLGRSLRKQRKHLEAEITYRMVLEIEPCRSTVVCNLASLLIDRKELVEAESILSRLLNANQFDRRALKRLGHLRETRKDYVGAAIMFRRWILEASEKDGIEPGVAYQKVIKKIRDTFWCAQSHSFQHNGIRRAVQSVCLVAHRLSTQRATTVTHHQIQSGSETLPSSDSLVSSPKPATTAITTTTSPSASKEDASKQPDETLSLKVANQSLQLPPIPREIWDYILRFLKGKDFLHVHFPLPGCTRR
eukprot:m.68816 g.68816  ORF g.68816 m.68816 type:complete len:365 (-) comp24000_c0_seq1:81-1175(-)